MPRTCSYCGNEITNSESRNTTPHGDPVCDHCIEERGLIHCSHPRCHNYVEESNVYIGNSGFLCHDHWVQNYFICSECGGIHHREFEVGVQDRYICPVCFESKYFRCESCNCIHPIEKKQTITIRDRTLTVCSHCLETEFPVCPSCGNRHFRYENTEVRYMDKNGSVQIYRGCVNCIDKKFTRCSACGFYFLKEDNPVMIDDPNELSESKYCPSCFYTKKLINPYNFKPKFKIFAEKEEENDELYGIEDEIEIDFGSSRRDERNYEILVENDLILNVDHRKFISYNINKLVPEFLYQKNDGSLRNGIEIVSHPASYSNWMKRYDDIEKLFTFLKENNCCGDEATTAGMHVHISKKNMNKNHMNALNAFIYGNAPKIQKIAGRKANNYNRFVKINKKADDINVELERKISTYDRYMAVNWTNRNTVEIRIFQSTLDPKRFMSNLEFCKAAYNFTKDKSITECLSQRVWRNFCIYVRESDFKFLSEKICSEDIWPKKLAIVKE